MSAQDGGPAYPVMWDYADNETGKSLRDWFAGQAPEMPDQWWLDTKADYGSGSGSYAEAIAAWNYFYADAMIAARGGE